ncbi:MAG: HAD hydrolase-like protein [Patescibacteria group bacterium]|nr:HAD hydrolase-like protein [Patescibacteria group bacterium]
MEEAKKAKAVIFDWSGVIKDALTTQLWVVNKMFAHFGVSAISLEELKDNWEQPYMLFFNKYLPELTIEEEQRLYRQIMGEADCPKSSPFPGIVDFIKGLKDQGYFLAVISSDWPETIFPEVTNYGLDNVFDEVSVGVHDKREGVCELVEKYSLDPTNTFLVGDSGHEVDAAKKANITSVAVTWGYDTEAKLESTHPDFIVHTIDELRSAII